MGKKGERRIDVRQCKHNGERAVEQEVQRMTSQVNILQQRVQDPVCA
jgi:hypothetical protein